MAIATTKPFLAILSIATLAVSTGAAPPLSSLDSPEHDLPNLSLDVAEQARQCLLRFGGSVDEPKDAHEPRRKQVRISFKNANLDDHDFRLILPCVYLLDQALSQLGVTDSCLVLDLRFTRVTGAALGSLGSLRNPLALDLTSTPISGPGLREVARVRTLRELRLDRTYLYLSDLNCALRALAPTLTSLSLASSTFADDMARTPPEVGQSERIYEQCTGGGKAAVAANRKRLLEMISKLPDLTALNLSGIGVTDMRALTPADPSKLSRLFLGNNKGLCLDSLCRHSNDSLSGRSNPDGFNLRFDRLEVLVMPNTQLGDSAVFDLRNLESLKDLDLSDNGPQTMEGTIDAERAQPWITDGALLHLTSRQLQVLNLSRTLLTDKGVNTICTGSTPNSITSLGQSLTTLKLAGTGITKLGPLAALPNLRFLDVSNTDVTEGEVSAFLKKVVCAAKPSPKPVPPINLYFGGTKVTVGGAVRLVAEELGLRGVEAPPLPGVFDQFSEFAVGAPPVYWPHVELHFSAASPP